MEPKKTALFETHQKLKANIIDFHGVLLPVLYSSIQEEHQAVRNGAGLFDVSHMGNIMVRFPDLKTAIRELNRLLPNDFSKIRKGKIIYSPLLNEKGTVIDDLLVMCMNDELFHIVVNASNIDTDYQWIKKHLSGYPVENLSDSLSILAVQGPKSVQFLSDYFKTNLNQLKSFECIEIPYLNQTLTLSRTGYTGEDGIEIYLPNQGVTELWNHLLENGKHIPLLPCGLGARDTLRLEAGLPLYGQELDENHSPLQSMIRWSVKLNKTEDFIGKNALLNHQDQFKDLMIGFESEGRSIARTGMEILSEDDQIVGQVTSGTFSITLKKNIGIAFIKPGYENKPLKIKIRNKTENIKIVSIPFYKRIKGV
jgi:aminomethyltransferase